MLLAAGVAAVLLGVIVASWPVHEHDVADVAVAALLRDGHHGKAYDLSSASPTAQSARDHADKWREIERRRASDAG